MAQPAKSLSDPYCDHPVTSFDVFMNGYIREHHAEYTTWERGSLVAKGQQQWKRLPCKEQLRYKRVGATSSMKGTLFSFGLQKTTPEALTHQNKRNFAEHEEAQAAAKHQKSEKCPESRPPVANSEPEADVPALAIAEQVQNALNRLGAPRSTRSGRRAVATGSYALL